MTQLLISLEDKSLLNDIVNAIRQIRGVVDVYECENVPNATTLNAMHDAMCGNTILCDTMEDYLKAVAENVQD